MIDQNYVFERMSEDKLPDFYHLFKTREKDYSLDYFEKRYNTSWTGKKFVGIIGYDERNEPIAHIGTFPMIIEFQGKTYITCQLGDLIVHPNHQKKGLFVALIDHLCELAKQEDIDFLHACPNKQADPQFNKKGWKCVDFFKSYSFPVLCIPLNKIANKYNLLKLYDIYIRTILWLFTKNNNLTFKNSVIDSETGGVIKDSNYRMYKNFSYNYITTIHGFKFWWKIDDGLSIGDIERFDLQKRDSLFKTLRFLCFILGFHNFKIVTTNNTFIDNQLKDSFPFEKGNNVYFWDISSGLDFTKIKFMQTDLNTF